MTCKREGRSRCRREFGWTLLLLFAWAVCVEQTMAWQKHLMGTHSSIRGVVGNRDVNHWRKRLVRRHAESDEKSSPLSNVSGVSEASTSLAAWTAQKGLSFEDISTGEKRTARVVSVDEKDVQLWLSPSIHVTIPRHQLSAAHYTRLRKLASETSSNTDESPTSLVTVEVTNVFPSNHTVDVRFIPPRWSVVKVDPLRSLRAKQSIAKVLRKSPRKNTTSLSNEKAFTRTKIALSPPVARVNIPTEELMDKILRGTIVRMYDYGALVSLDGTTTTALLPLRSLPRDIREDPTSYLSTGTDVYVRIHHVKATTSRLYLSLEQISSVDDTVQMVNGELNKLPPHRWISAYVEEVTPTGLIVRVGGTDIRGFLKSSLMSRELINTLNARLGQAVSHPLAVFSVGDVLRVHVRPISQSSSSSVMVKNGTTPSGVVCYQRETVAPSDEERSTGSFELCSLPFHESNSGTVTYSTYSDWNQDSSSSSHKQSSPGARLAASEIAAFDVETLMEWWQGAPYVPTPHDPYAASGVPTEYRDIFHGQLADPGVQFRRARQMASANETLIAEEALRRSLEKELAEEVGPLADLPDYFVDWNREICQPVSIVESLSVDDVEDPRLREDLFNLQEELKSQKPDLNSFCTPLPEEFNGWDIDEDKLLRRIVSKHRIPLRGLEQRREIREAKHQANPRRRAEFRRNNAALYIEMAKKYGVNLPENLLAIPEIAAAWAAASSSSE